MGYWNQSSVDNKEWLIYFKLFSYTIIQPECITYVHETAEEYVFFIISWLIWNVGQ